MIAINDSTCPLHDGCINLLNDMQTSFWTTSISIPCVTVHMDVTSGIIAGIRDALVSDLQLAATNTHCNVLSV